MFKPGGVMITCDGVVTYEEDTVTCAHCQQICRRKTPPFLKGIARDVIDVSDGDDPADIGGMCYGCARVVCFKCLGEAQCNPRMKQIEAEEEAAFRWEQNRRELGL